MPTLSDPQVIVVTDVTQEYLKKTVVVYPNPGTTANHIKHDQPAEVGGDLTGKVIISGGVELLNTNFSIADFKSGI